MTEQSHNLAEEGILKTPKQDIKKSEWQRQGFEFERESFIRCRTYFKWLINK